MNLTNFSKAKEGMLCFMCNYFALTKIIFFKLDSFELNYLLIKTTHWIYESKKLIK